MCHRQNPANGSSQTQFCAGSSSFIKSLERETSASHGQCMRLENPGSVSVCVLGAGSCKMTVQVSVIDCCKWLVTELCISSMCVCVCVCVCMWKEREREKRRRRERELTAFQVICYGNKKVLAHMQLSY